MNVKDRLVKAAQGSDAILMSDFSSSYLEWALQHVEFDSDVAQEIRNELEARAS